MNYKIAQFILTPPQRNQSILEIFVAQPDADKEALAGKLFALIEIESTKAENLKIINFLINTLNHNYYQSEKMILRERVSSIKIEHIFEAALAKTNKKLAEFLQTENIKLNPNLLNITIGVVYNDSLHFSNLGKNKALLIYKNKAEEAPRYKLADISEQTGSSEAKKSANLVKLFSNVISGAVPRSGYFLFTNETFSEYLSAKQIINIVTTLPPASAAEQIKNTLSKINVYVPFLGIIIKNTTGLEIAEVKIKEPAVSTMASIENLQVTEEKTEKLLTPSGLVSAKKWSSWISNLFSRFSFGRPKKLGAAAFTLKDKIFAKKKASWLSPAKIFNFLKSFLLYLTGFFIFIFKIITDKKALKEFFNNLVVNIQKARLTIKTALANFFIWYKYLSKVNKILFSVFIICLLLFSANLGWQAVKNQQAQKQLAISGLTAAIEQKQNQIDASLLYNNEAGAKALLEEVKAMLAQLPQKTQEQKDKYNSLTAKNQVQIEKISRVIKANPIELANFINLNANAKPVNIILANGKIYAADSVQSAVYTIDLSSKLITTISLNSQDISSLKFPSLDKDNNIYYLNANKLAVLDVKTEKASALAIDFQAGLAGAIDLKQYNSRFYLTDGLSGQIYRFNKSADKISGAVPWLNSEQNLTSIASMDIDGSVYLLDKSGRVQKYTKGEIEEFSLDQVEPSFSQAEKISATAEQNYIYISEPKNKRLVVFDKNGKFINQYTSDKFNNLKDFQVDEKNKKIYLLNGAAVFVIDLTLNENK